MGIGKNEANGYSLATDIMVAFKEIDQETADALVALAHEICPYSNATRGNIDVSLSTMVK